MKKTRFPSMLLLLYALFAPFSPLSAQNSYYAIDSTCGCDIFYTEGIKTTREGNLYGFQRYDGTIVAPPIFAYVGQFTDGYCLVWQFDSAADYNPSLSEPPLLAGLIDSTGRFVVPCAYDNVALPSEGRVAVMKGNLWGFSDLRGHLVIPLQFHAATPFSDGRSAVTTLVDSNFFFGNYIDTLGHLLFAPDRFQRTLPYIDGYAAAMRYERWGIIDRDGNVFIKGRSKNMLLGANGQNIYPEEIEDKLNSLPMVAECVVIQKGEKIYGLVYPDMEACQKQGMTAEAIADLMETNRQTLNRQLPAYEQIAGIKVMKEEFEKTPKKSIKRFLYTDEEV
jgi:hypothetical protein